MCRQIHKFIQSYNWHKESGEEREKKEGISG